MDAVGIDTMGVLMLGQSQCLVYDNLCDTAFCAVSGSVHTFLGAIAACLPACSLGCLLGVVSRGWVCLVDWLSGGLVDA